MKFIKIITTAFIGFVSLIFFTVAVAAISSPDMVMETLKVQALDASAYNSIRSVYGGLNLAIGAFLAYGAMYLRKASLGLIVLYMGGFLFGRIYSFMVNGLSSKLVLSWTFVEAILFIVSLLLLRSLVKARKEERQTTFAPISSWN